MYKAEKLNNKIHYFESDISHIPLPEKFTYPFRYEPHTLSVMASEIVKRHISENIDEYSEAKDGKMFGVLIIRDKQGKTGFLAAYSGLLNNRNDHPFFVPPVYDLLNPDGYFKAEEKRISDINKKIGALESDPDYISLKKDFNILIIESDREIAEFKELMKAKKILRDRKRNNLDENCTEESLLAESRFLKAEFKRLQKKLSDKIEKLKENLQQYEEQIRDLKKERKESSAILQRRLFDSFRMKNAKGEVKGLCDIFGTTAIKFPPAGSGECCAPKLLQYAYIHNLKPVAMAEFWIGESPKSIIRKEGNYYPSCTGKCGPILSFMLQGLDVESNPVENIKQPESLEVIYEDNNIIVINKPQGMLSVPGKNNTVSALEILKQNTDYQDLNVYAVHRLDMATSGLLMFAKGEESYKRFQSLFAEHNIEKHYIAVLDGLIQKNQGIIDLPLSSDYLERPKQKVDFENGKRAITIFKVISAEKGKTRIDFMPVTGRTHQLRMHSSHISGLDTPILGDELYGKKDKRLYLHSYSMRFIHPFTQKEIYIVKDADF